MWSCIPVILATGRAEAGELSWVWGCLGYISGPEASLGYSVRLCLKNKQTKPSFIQNFRNGAWGCRSVCGIVSTHRAQVLSQCCINWCGTACAPIYTPSPWDLEAGGAEVAGCPWLHIRFDGSLKTEHLYLIIQYIHVFHVLIVLTFTTMHFYGLGNRLHAYHSIINCVFTVEH